MFRVSAMCQALCEILGKQEPHSSQSGGKERFNKQSLKHVFLIVQAQ